MTAFPVEDERRYDIPESEAFTPGEARNMSFTITVRTGVDGNGDGVYEDEESFTAYDEWEFYVMDDRRDAGATQSSRRSGSIYYLTEGAGITESTVPAVSVAHSAEQTALVSPGDRWYEFWVKINGGWSRIRYGTIPFKD